MDITEARKRFAEARELSYVDPAELDEIWAALEPIESAEMLGHWTGDEFQTGNRMNGQLAAAGWYGKFFDSINDVKPIVCRGEDGTLANNDELSKGGATLWNIEFRGEVTATMVYDGQPIFDHFKRVDDNTVMGIMNGKYQRAKDSYYYFLLERDAQETR
ncbi:DUF4334 domain-containing protein [Millisia brevis]|uniref:DUF4334 domain-containing protein n=1 Tax=Millisia brevis TaxID=264148 RepID=UPI00082BFA23|nr:DUF4334 domain-containing protein [Millisia brevis]